MYTQIKWNYWISAGRTSSRSSRRTPSTRSSTSSCTVITAKLGITWSSWWKSQWNGRIEEVSEFHLRRIRESEKLKTVLELYDLETHQKKAEPDYHRLKTMVKRSIEQDVRNKNFGARNGNSERNAVVKNQGTKQRVQRILGDCWQWESNGQCSRRDNCSFRHDMDKRGKSTQPNSSPRSSTQQNVNNASITKSPRGRSPSGKMAQLQCKDHTSTGNLCSRFFGAVN